MQSGTTMKTYLLAGLAGLVFLGGGLAQAGDLPSSKYLPLAPPLPKLYSWTGFYLGAQGAYSWGGDTTRQFTTLGGIPVRGADYGLDSAIGGVQAGFNYQTGGIVLGVEGDVDFGNASGGFDAIGARVRVEQDWQASVRARIGYAFDRFMIYASGGVAFSEFKYGYLNTLPAVAAGESASFSRTGWTVGGGVNYAMTDNIVLGVDYRYADYGKFDHAGRAAFLGVTSAHEPTTHAVRASVAYKF